MASGKPTEIMSSNSRVTEVLNQNTANESNSGKTVLQSARDTNVTWVMGADGASEPIRLTEGVEIDQYQIEDVIAENTGEATLLRVIKDHKPYVLKLYHKNQSPKTELQQLLKEIDSEYVVQPLSYGEYYERYYEILPFFPKGDLLACMPISEEMIISIIVPSINEGLHALHQKDIIHRDIKPSNIYLQDNKAVIGDFGISSVLNNDVSVRATSMSRTLGYSAPEASNGFVSKESDYYSFGITIYHLVLGTDPFAGMSDMQILYQTINKKIELPQTFSERMKRLIRGLTLKDRTDRWGYYEVCKWINGEDVPVVERMSSQGAPKPYTFYKQKYTDLQSLSLAFAESWENAKRHLYRGLVDKYFATFDQDIASQCMDLKELEDRDVAVFRLIYLLNPNAPLCYKGKLYSSINALGDEMEENLPQTVPDIQEMTQNGCLLHFLQNGSYEEDLVNEVSEIQSELLNGKTVKPYFRLMYYLKPDIGYTVNEVRCSDVSDLITYLESIDATTRDICADQMVNDVCFLAWLEAQGYQKQVSEWEKLSQKVDWK